MHLIVGKLNAALSAGWINISSWPGLQPLILQIFLWSWSAVLNIWMTRRALLKHNLSNASACVHIHSCPVVGRPFSIEMYSEAAHVENEVRLPLDVRNVETNIWKIESEFWKHKLWFYNWKKRIQTFESRIWGDESKDVTLQTRTQEICQISLLKIDHSLLIPQRGNSGFTVGCSLHVHIQCVLVIYTFVIRGTAVL